MSSTFTSRGCAPSIDKGLRRAPCCTRCEAPDTPSVRARLGFKPSPHLDLPPCRHLGRDLCAPRGGAGYVYWSTASLLEDQTDNAIGSEIKAIAEVYRQNVKLPTGGKPRWRLLDAGLHLSFRPTNDGKGSGTWIARRYVG